MTRRDGADDPGSDSDPADDPTDREPPSDDTGSGTTPSSADPRRIESVAVTESDVIDALEAAARGGRDIVLRVTPPFSGRMRARIHDAGVVDGGDDPDGGTEAVDDAKYDTDAAAPVHVAPEMLVADPPTYPTVDDTEDALRASGTPYTRERHRERHRSAVEEWRTTVRERLVEEVTLQTDAGPTTVSVAYLG